MCKAIENMKDDARNEGRIEGHREARLTAIRNLMKKWAGRPRRPWMPLCFRLKSRSSIVR